jgi:predicted HTH domain antitoxin
VQAAPVQLTIQVPASIADAGAAERARLLLVLDAVRSERITWRGAAAELDVAPDRLLELAREHGIPVVRYDDDDWEDDLATLARLRGRRDA